MKCTGDCYYYHYDLCACTGRFVQPTPIGFRFYTNVAGEDADIHIGETIGCYGYENVVVLNEAYMIDGVPYPEGRSVHIRQTAFDRVSNG